MNACAVSAVYSSSSKMTWIVASRYGGLASLPTTSETPRLADVSRSRLRWIDVQSNGPPSRSRWNDRPASAFEKKPAAPPSAASDA